MKTAFKNLIPFFTVVFVLVVLSSFAFAVDETTIQTNITLCSVAKFLKGAGGWLIIGFGLILALWDYFIQKQGHLIIVAIVGILVVIVVGRVLASKAMANNEDASVIKGGFDCEAKCKKEEGCSNK